MIKQKIKNYVLGVCRASHEASKLSRTLSNTERNKILNAIIDQLSDHKDHIFKRNSLDVKIAIKNKMSDALIDRLLINDKRISSMIEGLKKIKSILIHFSKKLIKQFNQVEFRLSK